MTPLARRDLHGDRSTTGIDTLLTVLRLAFGMGDNLGSVRNWPSVFRVAVAERCATLAWVRCGAEIAGSAPTDVAAAFRSHFVANSLRVRSTLIAAQELASELRHAGIHPIILKGPPLAARLYADSAARVCSDLDWFVPWSKRAAIKEVMLGSGWQCIEGEGGHEGCYRSSGAHGSIYIEVHHTLLHRRFSYLLLPMPLATHATVDGFEVLVHQDALLPAYLCAHLATHRFAPLAWLVDVFEFWNALDVRSRAHARRVAAVAGIERYLSWGLRRAELGHRGALGDERAAKALGLRGPSRVEMHPMWRHIRLAPNMADMARAAQAWIAPDWASGSASAVRSMASRFATHWRAALPMKRGVV
jgi:hypothetical protein